MRRSIPTVVFVLSGLAYFWGFMVDHLFSYDRASEQGQRLLEASWDASLLLPLAAVGAAAYLRPKLWLALALPAFMLIWPLFVNWIEVSAGTARSPSDCGEPCIDTTILSINALPALALSCIGLFAGRRRMRAIRN